MKRAKYAGIGLAAVLCAVLAAVLLRSWGWGTRVSTPFEAAAVIEQALVRGEDVVVLRAPAGLDEDRLFRVLEAVWPYAFSLRCTTYAGGRLEITVEAARAAAQAQAALLAEEIALQQTQGIADDRGKLRALHDFLVRTCQYDVDAAARSSLLDGADNAFTAYGALVDGKAVCAGYARAFVLLCRSAGLDAVYIADERMNHGWNAVRLDGETLYIDCTFDDPVPDRGDYVSDDFFLISADRLAATHTWDRTFYTQVMDARWGA